MIYGMFGDQCSITFAVAVAIQEKLLDGSCTCHEQATAGTTPKPKGTARKHTDRDSVANSSALLVTALST
ncbi:hypothetical protein D5086_018145 [Populus alba]|uniref:Uncharacterized protein n=1 Tax=Populus alba TaxID=43335 RepID=A0ACC4BNV6_POPAL